MTMSMISLPDPPDPAGDYQAVVIRNGMGFVSGQFPFRDAKLSHTGRVGVELSEEEGQEACRISALNVLAQISKATDGFDQLDGLLRLEGYVASSDSFCGQPSILNSASQLFSDVLGDRGIHARTAFSVTRLPLNAPIELCVSFATKG